MKPVQFAQVSNFVHSCDCNSKLESCSLFLNKLSSHFESIGKVHLDFHYTTVYSVQPLILVYTKYDSRVQFEVLTKN